MTHSYRAPAFFVEHFGAGDDVTVSSPDPTVADRGPARAVDGRLGVALEYTTAGLRRLDFDFSASKDAETLLVLGDHNLSGNVLVSSGPDSGSLTQRASITASPGIPVYGTWSHTGDLYWRLTWPNSGNPTRVPQAILGNAIVTLVRGPDPAWETPVRSPVEVAEFPAFEATLVLGPPRRVWRLEISAAAAAADLALFDALQALGRSRPFAFLPPDDSYEWTWVALEADWTYRQDWPIPQQEIRYGAELVLVEQA